MALLRTLEDPEGRTVEVLRRIGGPPQWFLRRSLATGALYSHLREQDGPTLAEPTIAEMRVRDSINGLPMIAHDYPFESAVSSRADLHQLAVCAGTPDFGQTTFD